MSAGAVATTLTLADGDVTGFEQKELNAPVASDFFPGGNIATPLLAASIGTQRQNVAFVPTATVVKSFEGISQYDVASYSRNFIPPDTMGAVGKTQFVEFVNGGFAVFGKNGTVQVGKSDVSFWAAAGQTGTKGDSRVLYNKAADRWIALSFGASTSDIQSAVSNTSDAAGTWQSTKFTGFAGGTADYPTLAMDNNAVYIGTNNFSAAGSFKGTTLNIIPLASLINATAPTTTGLASSTTAYTGYAGLGTPDGGYAIQGVNSTAATTTGHIESASLFYTNLLRYDVTNVGTPGQTIVNATYLDNAVFDSNKAARQPNAVADAPTAGSTFTNNNRVIDTSDDRVGSSIYENNGKIYSVRTLTPTSGSFTVVRYDVVDAATNTLLDEGEIGDASHDYFQGSLSVNANGQVVIAYNRSGSGADGKISFLARIFSTDPSGHLTQRGAESLLKVSTVDDYHNGSVNNFVAAGRQRWGDYSQVTVDPTNSQQFWVIGQFAKEYNDGVDHPGGTGGSRWGTWISAIDAGTQVPEPATWAMMLVGFGLVGAAVRRRPNGFASA